MLPGNATQVAARQASFAEAAALQAAGDLERAAAEYRRFLAAHPANAEARSNLAVVLMGLGHYEEAITAYRTALEAAPASVPIRLNLGIGLYKAQRLQEAATELGAVLAADPGNLQARYLTADALLRLGRPEQAVALLQPLETSRRDDLPFAYLYGMALLQAKEPAKGQLLIDRILKNGESAEARVLMGVAKRGAGDLNGAVADLKRAVEINPDLPGVRGLYGQALLEAGNPDVARPEFEAELARNTLDFDANLQLGVLLKGEQNYDAALRHLTKALGVRPGDIATRFQIAGIGLARRETASAAAMLEGIVRDAPTFVEAHVALATAYYRLERKADGDRERATVERLNAERNAGGTVEAGAAPARRAPSSAAPESPTPAQSPTAAQSPAATQSPAPPPDHPAAPPATAALPQGPTVRSETAAVILDAVVRDRQGRPVRDLRPDEVTVTEDGTPREIRSFRLIEHAASPAAGAAATTAASAPRVDETPSLVTLVFDHLPQGARALARKAALQFVEGERPPNQWVAIFVLDQRLRLAQAFTRDAGALRRAVEGATSASAESPDRMAAQGDPGQTSRSAEAALAQTTAGRAGVDGAAIGAAVTEARVSEVVSRMARMVETADVQQRGQSTFFPLMALMKAQGALAGRKALLFFSEGLQIPPNLEDAYRSAISEANRANVSIYTIDARGLDTGRALDSSRQMLDRSGRNSQSQQVRGSSQRPVTLDDVMNSEVAEGALRANVQDALRALAEETGGALIGNSNDMGAALVRRVQSDLDSYYEIGYVPAATPLDGRFRALQVKVARRGVTVHSRSGYFALPGTDTSPLLPYELPMLAAASAGTPPSAFPYAAGVFRFDRSPRGVQHVLLLEVPLEHLTFEEKRQNRTYALRFTAMALVKDDAGQVIRRLSETFPLEGPLDRLPALKRGRLRFTRQFDLPPGRYTIQTVARDQATERASVKSLPLEVPAPSDGIRISDVSIVGRVDRAEAAAGGADDDPLLTGPMRIVPNLSMAISKAANTQISAFMTIYPRAGGAKPEEKPALTVEFVRDGAVVGRSGAVLPDPDESGRIKYVASFPTAPFAPGTYELRAVATQGAASARAATSFALIP